MWCLWKTILGKRVGEALKLALVFQRMDNTIRQIDHYPEVSTVCFVNTYPLNSDLSVG